jgi:hypothetical protein
MDYFERIYFQTSGTPLKSDIHSCPQLIELIHEVGFLPLLDSGIAGYSAEGLLAEECRYVEFPDGSWEWPLWQWKGSVIAEGNCVYGKFFAGKAGFISLEWWNDFCNWRRSRNPLPPTDSIEDIILTTLREHGSIIARQLRAECGMTGQKMRSRFDSFVGRLQMGTWIVTEDFIYPRDRHGHEYGFGWSLLTTPERLHGSEACKSDRTPDESYARMFTHLQQLLPGVSEKQITRLLK